MHYGHRRIGNEKCKVRYTFSNESGEFNTFFQANNVGFATLFQANEAPFIHFSMKSATLLYPRIHIYVHSSFGFRIFR